MKSELCTAAASALHRTGRNSRSLLEADGNGLGGGSARAFLASGNGHSPPEPVFPEGTDCDKFINTCAVSHLLALAKGSPTYDKEAALISTIASTWAYGDASTLRDTLDRSGLPNDTLTISVINDALLVRATAFLVRSPCGRFAMLCFRGTEPTSIINWLTDASVVTEPFGAHGNVHGGFLRNVLALWPYLRGPLQAMLRGEAFEPCTDEAVAAQKCHLVERQFPGGWTKGAKLEALFITGHSLGGGMAALMGALLFDGANLLGDRSLTRELRDVLRGVYTFGQPMVGDAAFRDWANSAFGHKLLFRHVYGADMVPAMPPRTTGAFRHFGKEYRSTRDGWQDHKHPVEQARAVISSLSIGILAAIQEILPGFPRVPLPYSSSDHSPLHYLRTSMKIQPGAELYAPLRTPSVEPPQARADEEERNGRARDANDVKGGNWPGAAPKGANIDPGGH